MATARPLKLPPRRTGLAAVASRKNLPTLGLGAVAIIIAGLIARDVFFPPSSTTPVGLRTATVAMGTVTNSVTATGSLVPAQQMSLGFKTAGTLTAVDVRVGDHVKAGQLLATIDPAPLQLALQSAQATLASAQAALSNTLSGTALTQAQHQLDQANQAYTDAVNAANQANAADQSTTNADTVTLNADQASLAADQAAISGSVLYQTDLKQLAADQAKFQTDTNAFDAAGCPAMALPYDPTCAAALALVQGDQALLNADKMKAATDLAVAAPNLAADQARVPADQARVNADNAKTNADTQAGQRSIQQAQNALTNAQDGYNSQAVNRPATIQQQQAQVASASAMVDTGQANLKAATLNAPVDGVVTSLTAQAGDNVSPATGSSGAEAPGTTAPLPSSGSGSSAAGSGGFLTLISDKAYVTVVSFAESDAAKVAAGQAGTVTFDAFSGLSIPIHVLAVAGSSTVSSNVVNYYVTLTLDSLDDRLKAGLTTNATVVTARAANVLVIPNAAITRRGTATTVNLLQNGKEVVTDIVTGIAGTSTTEVMSGLKAGDSVVLPTTAPRTTTGGSRSFGGGGGGFVTGGG